MRILLIGNYPPDGQESMLRFGELMQRELAARGHQVTLLQPQPRLAKSIHGLGKWFGYADKFLLFPATLRREKHKFDLVHILDHSNSLYARHLTDVPNLITCHDVLAIKSALGEVPQNPVGATGKRLQALILNGLKLSQYVVCDSQASQQDMLRITGRNPNTSTVVYLSLNYHYTPMPREQALPILANLGFPAETPYFIHVGGSAWYKNRLTLLKLFALLRQLSPAGPMAIPRMLFVGGPIEPDMQAFIHEAGLADHVSRISGVTNEELRAAYSLSAGLLFPSLQEGFGWPILEAQGCGCPVFATDRKPMTELGGDAAVYFDPADIGAAAATIAAELSRVADLRRLGLANIQRFSVQRMIDGYMQAYQHVTHPA